MEEILKNKRVKKYLDKGYDYFTITESGKITAIVFWKEGEANKTIDFN